MINSELIHRSIADADDLEEVRDEEITVVDVFHSLVQHPAQIVLRWNWKSALIGAILRASFYFTVYKASKENWAVTLTAVLVELSFRFLTSGISGSLIQSFRRATPAWLATLIVTISLPLFSHTIEYVTHFAQENYFNTIFAASENNARSKAFAISVMFSILAALFNLFIMRQGVLLVGAGEETKSFWSDLKQIPLLVVQFITFLPKEILRAIGERRIVTAIGIFLGFGLAVGTIFGVFRGKWKWAWTTGTGAWVILLFVTFIVLAVMGIPRKNSKG